MPISVTEQFALLALDQARGKPYDRAGTALPHALAATLLVDLESAGAIDTATGDRVTAGAAAPDDPLLEEAWRSISEDRKPRRPRDWIAKPSRLVKGLPTTVYERLVAREVLRVDGHSAVLHRDRFAALDEHAEDDLVGALAAVLEGEREPSDGDLLLLALLPVSRLTSAVFPDRDRKATERRIDELVGAPVAGTASAVARSVAGEVAVVVAAGAAATG